MNGYYIGAMGMLSSQNHINTTSNNITNSETSGYKFDSTISKVFEIKNANREEDGKNFIGDFENKVTEEGTIVDLRPGLIETTNRGLDVSLGDSVDGTTSFFVVNKGNQNLLTRSGEFELSEDRTLRTVSNAYVLDVNNKKIQIPEGVEPSINKKGQVVNADTGEVIAQLQTRVIDKANRQLLVKQPSAMFSLDGTTVNTLPVGNPEFRSNTLEKSNVDMGKEMVDLLNEQKRFQASQKIMLMFDKVYDKENQMLR